MNINGNLYHAIKTIYQKPLSSVQFDGQLTDWFPITAGVRQGDFLSPLLFTIYINDLVKEMHDIECGVKIGGENLSLLLYADDIVILSDSEANMQKNLDVMSQWCRKWRMSINVK